MDMQLLAIGFCSLVVGIFLMIKYKFYRYKINDARFDTKLRVFMGSLILTISGIIIVIHAFAKLL